MPDNGLNPRQKEALDYLKPYRDGFFQRLDRLDPRHFPEEIEKRVGYTKLLADLLGISENSVAFDRSIGRKGIAGVGTSEVYNQNRLNSWENLSIHPHFVMYEELDSSFRDTIKHEGSHILDRQRWRNKISTDVDEFFAETLMRKSEYFKEFLPFSPRGKTLKRFFKNIRPLRKFLSEGLASQFDENPSYDYAHKFFNRFLDRAAEGGKGVLKDMLEKRDIFKVQISFNHGQRYDFLKVDSLEPENYDSSIYQELKDRMEEKFGLEDVDFEIDTKETNYISTDVALSRYEEDFEEDLMNMVERHYIQLYDDLCRRYRYMDGYAEKIGLLPDMEE